MFGLAVTVWLICLIAAIVTIAQKKSSKAWWLVGGAAFIAMFPLAPPSEKPDSPHDAASTPKPRSVAKLATPRAAPEAPTPTPNRHEERQSIQAYWNPIILKMAFAQTSLDFAIKSIGEGDTVSASSLLKKGSEYANDAMMSTNEGHPEELNSVADDLGVAANEFRSGLDDIRSFLDDRKPSQGASAQAHAAEARARLESATHQARVVYISMGGKGSDLEDVDSKRQTIAKIFEALSQ
jgi:hypothetical protein